MRSWMFALILVGGAAAGQQPPARPVAGAGDRPAMQRGIGDQIFVAPSGEPFRAPAGAAYPVSSWFTQADRNHDGRISESEFAGDFARFFATLDQDHDGMLRPDEILLYERDIAPEVQSGGGGGYDGRRGGFDAGGDFGKLNQQDQDTGSTEIGDYGQVARDMRAERPSGGGRFGLINIPEPVASMDTDFSGTVTQQEMRAAAHRRFVLLQGEATGGLTLDGLPKTWAQLHPRRERKR